MTDDLAIQRAAGVIVWALTVKSSVTGRAMTEEEAVAKASDREPELSERDLAAALAWAQGAIAAALLCNMAPGKHTLADILDKCGVPWRE